MESTVSIEQYQEELQSWKHELSAFKHEIRQFESKLEVMAAKNLPKNLLAGVEHFQNSFICQKEVIDKLRHDLPDSPYKVENIFKSLYAVAVDNKSEDILRDRMDMFRRIYEEVKDDFKRFESDWM